MSAEHTLYWTPHAKHVWVLSSKCSKDQYKVVYPKTTEEEGIFELNEQNLNDLCLSFCQISKLFQLAFNTKDYNALILPLTNENDKLPYDDICHISSVCEPSVLHCIRERYYQDKVYSNVGTIVISLNPFHLIENLYDETLLQKYTEEEYPYQLPPHIYQIASSCCKAIFQIQKSQAVLITGDSGSGKTECTKRLLEFIVFVNSRNVQALISSHLKKTQASSQEKAFSTLQKESQEMATYTASNLLSANILLEAFGNAKTIRNFNSSRFGKWIQMFYGTNHLLLGARIQPYLLELSRVTQHVINEQAYHIFYLFLLELKKKKNDIYCLIPGIEGINTYPYLISEKGEKLTLENLPLSSMPTMEDVYRCFENNNVTKEEQECIFCILASILHIGSVEFLESEDVASATHNVASKDHLQAVCRLINFDISNREIKTGQECIVKPLKLSEAMLARDTFSKLLYKLLFQWIVNKINKNLHPNEKENGEQGCFIGFLDFAGFESFAVNGFEQLCINYANEKLQHQFNQDIFFAEQNFLREEGVFDKTISYNDNSSVLKTLEASSGLFALLSEEMLVPRGSDANFVAKFLKSCQNNSCVTKPKIKQAQSFTIHHFAETVTYSVNGWLEKNNSSPPELAIAALQIVQNQVIQSSISASSSLINLKKKSGRTTVTTSFQNDLNHLLAVINQAETHYIRCIKPNSQSIPRVIDALDVCRQLLCSGVMEAIKIHQSGYPIRMFHRDFLVRFGLLYGRKFTMLYDAHTDTSTACKLLVEHLCTALGILSDAIALGKTRVFITLDGQKSLDDFRRLYLEIYVKRIQACFRGYIVRKYFLQSKKFSKSLGPILGIGVAALRQHGFLYPTCLIKNVTTPLELQAYSQSVSQLLNDASSQLPETFLPLTFKKASAIQKSMEQEAFILISIEQLVDKQHYHMHEVQTLLEKAQKKNILHPLIDQLQNILNQLKYEHAQSSEMERISANNDTKGASILLEEIQNELANRNLSSCLTKKGRAFVENHSKIKENNPIIKLKSPKKRESVILESNVYPPEDLQTTEHSPEHHTYGADEYYDSDTCSLTAEELTSNSSSYSNYNSTEHESTHQSNTRLFHSSKENKSKPLQKFCKELRSCIACLDSERLNILLEAYENEQPYQQCADEDYLEAKELQQNLHSKDWVLQEIRKATKTVVWGDNDRLSFIRLIHLIKRADALNIPATETQAAKEILSRLRNSSQEPYKEALKDHVRCVPQYDLIEFPRLAINQQLKAKRLNVIRHSYKPLKHPLLYYKKKSPDIPIALDMFLYVQRYMGDRFSTTRDELSDILVQLAISRPTIRDELYVQLMKQLTQNPNFQSVSRGWSLLFYCCSSFPPSLDLLPYLRYFIFSHTTSTSSNTTQGVLYATAEVAEQALKELAHFSSALSENEDKKEVSEETKEDPWDIDIFIQMMDESRQKISIHQDTNIAHVISEICSRLRMAPTGWTIMLLYPIDQMTVDSTLQVLDILNVDLLSRQIILSSLYTLWKLPQLYIVPESFRVWDIWDAETETFPRFLFRRRMITSSELLYPHPTHAHLTYKQILWEFRYYTFPEPMILLACIIARILIADRWAPNRKTLDEISSGRLDILSNDSMNPRMLARIVCMTYSMFETSGYLPVLFYAYHPTFQKEWQHLVQQAYMTYDSHEHQLLAINSLITQARKLKAFGGISWLVTEPNSTLCTKLLANSQLYKLYTGTSVQINPGCIVSLLRCENLEQQKNKENGEKDLQTISQDLSYNLQPLVLTPYDLVRMQGEVNMQFNEETVTSTTTSENEDNTKLWTRFKRKISNMKTLYSRNILQHLQSCQFAPGINFSDHILQPLWMSFNSQGLHFAPAVSFAYTNWIQFKPLCIPSSQLFACETLWIYQTATKMWTYGGIVLCADLRSSPSQEPLWCLLVLIPLSCTASCIHATLQAFLPSLHSYGETISEEVATNVDTSISNTPAL